MDPGTGNEVSAYAGKGSRTSAAERPLVFLSYAHEDRELCRRLGEMLTLVLKTHGYRVWWDDSISGGEWNPQIVAALETAVAGVVLVTRHSLASKFVMSRELPRLLERGCVVAPVYGAPCPFENMNLVGRLQFLGSADESLSEILERGQNALDRALSDIASRAPEILGLPAIVGDSLVAAIRPQSLRDTRTRSDSVGELYGVPELPIDYFERSEELGALRRLLIGPGSATVGMGGSSAFGLLGEGGIGKSVLAASAARDKEVRRTFHDGVFWVALGEHPDPLAVQASLAEHLGVDIGSADVDGGRASLRAAFFDRHALLVIDDAWSAADAQVLSVTGPRGRILVTSRHSLVLNRLRASAMPVSRLEPIAAQNFLAHVSGCQELPLREADYVCRAVGGVVLALALIGGAVRHGTSWSDAAARIREGGTIYKGEGFANQFKALHLAWGALDDSDRQRYAELVVFGEDVLIPTSAIARYWRHVGGLDEPQSADLLERLSGRSLLTADENGFRCHDLSRAFLQLQTADSAVAHRRLLDAHRELLEEPQRWSSLRRDETYLWSHLVEHLVGVGDVSGLNSILQDPAWILLRFHHGGPHAPEADLLKVIRALPSDRRAKRMLHWLRQVSLLLTEVTSLPDRAQTMAGQMGDLGGSRALAGFFPEPYLHLSRPLIDTTAALERVLDPKRGAIRSVAWSADGRTILVGGDDGIMLWQPDETVKPPLRAERQTGSVRSVAWSPNGRRFAAGGDDGAVLVWESDGDGASFVVANPGHKGIVWAVAWSSDSRMLASGGMDGMVNVWSGDAFAAAPTVFLAHEGGVRSLAWSPADDRIATCGYDGAAKLWNVSDGSPPELCVESQGEPLRSITWSPDGRLLACSGDKGFVHLVDTKQSRIVASLGSGAHPVWSVSWSPDGGRIAIGDHDCRVAVIEVSEPDTQVELARHDLPVRSVVWSPDGQRLASSSDDGRVFVLGPHAEPSGALAKTADPPFGAVRSLVWSPDGRHIAIAAQDSRLVVLDPDDPFEAVIDLVKHEANVNTVDWSPDGELIASGSDDGVITIADTNLDARATPILAERRAGAVWCVSWSPDSRLLACGGYDGKIVVLHWDEAERTWLSVALGVFEGGVTSFAWAPDSTRLASAGDGSVRLWDPNSRGEYGVATVLVVPDETDRAIGSTADPSIPQSPHGTGSCSSAVVNRHKSWMRAVAWSPDGKYLIGAVDDGRILFWDVETKHWNAPVLLGFHTVRSLALAWSPDGRWLSSGEEFGALRLWDWEGRTEVCAIALGAAIYSISWNANRIAVGTAKGWSMIRVEVGDRKPRLPPHPHN